MTNRFARSYEKIRTRLGGRRKLALTIIAIWIAAELLAVVAVAVAGKDLLQSKSTPAKVDGDGRTLLFGSARSSPSIAVF